MSVTPGDLRAFGSQRIVLTTADGSFTGRLLPATLSDRAIVVLLEQDDPSPDGPLVVALADIEAAEPA